MLSLKSKPSSRSCSLANPHPRELNVFLIINSMTIKAIILTCLVSASSFAGMNEALHFTRSNRFAIPAVRRRPSGHRVVAAGKPADLNLEEVHALIASDSRKHGVPTALVNSIVATESNFRSDAVSSQGSIGLMQLRPSTARQYGADARVPQQNIDAGTRYLRFLIERYRHSSSPLKDVIAAYNAGFDAVDRYHGVPPFPETQDYVNRVLALMRHYQSQSA
jgi:soluble lytic murein transglycosylase-like protein